MKKIAIILAGGEGLRAGGGEPKQFRMLCGKPALWWSLKAFKEEDPTTQLIVVVHPNFIYEWEQTMQEMAAEEQFEQTIVCGGRSRWHSVSNALMEVTAREDMLIAVHDGARPLIKSEMIRRGWEAAKAHGAVVPAIPLSDSIRRMDNATDSHSVPRRDYVAVQTPQVFDASILKEGYAMPESPDFTDDASVVEAIGRRIFLYDGDPDNIKITYPRDIEHAEIIMRSK